MDTSDKSSISFSAVNTTDSLGQLVAQLQSTAKFQQDEVDKLKQVLAVLAPLVQTPAPQKVTPPPTPQKTTAPPAPQKVNAKAFWAKRKAAAQKEETLLPIIPEPKAAAPVAAAPVAAAPVAAVQVAAVQVAAAPAVLPEPKDRKKTALALKVFTVMTKRPRDALHKRYYQEITADEAATMFGDVTEGVDYSNKNTVHKLFRDVLNTYAHRGYGWDRTTPVSDFVPLNKAQFVKLKYERTEDGKEYYYVWVETNGKQVPLDA